MANKSTRYLALLRGINVGGKNIISKDDLRECFENLGLNNVRTYIQSGNILFRSESTSIKELTARIETALSNQFHYTAQAVVLSHKQYLSELQAAPKNWGHDEEQKHNALFLIGGLKPTKVMAQLPSPIDKYEQVDIAKGTIFWSASKKNLGKTTIMKLGSMPVYKQMTVRNHNTTFKLLTLLEEL
jgi:uncharacterized protein (DUF1697 family)